jgi:hypothetical protein
MSRVCGGHMDGALGELNLKGAATGATPCTQSMRSASESLSPAPLIASSMTDALWAAAQPPPPAQVPQNTALHSHSPSQSFFRLMSCLTAWLAIVVPLSTRDLPASHISLSRTGRTLSVNIEPVINRTLRPRISCTVLEECNFLVNSFTDTHDPTK